MKNKIKLFDVVSSFFSLSLSSSLNAHTVLLTGEMGYIGSHVAVELLNLNHSVIILDNLSNSSKTVLDRIEEITNKRPMFYQIDLKAKSRIGTVFQKHRINTVMHFAGSKAVGESVKQPLAYYENNIVGSVYLLQVMKKYGCKNLIFSSSATVYGSPQKLPIDEYHITAPTNPYGETKLMVEKIIRDTAKSDLEFRAIALRYFNPIGSHESGLIGEAPRDTPNNLMPYVMQVVQGRQKKLNVYGDDYNTHDGTGVRDYVHVIDLAKGHVSALEHLSKTKHPFRIYNLGTGKGYSVLEIVKAVEAKTKKTVPYEIRARRQGDVASVYADPVRAKNELGWKANYGLQEMVNHAVNWAQKNPHGYDK